MRLHEVHIGNSGKILKIHSPELEMTLMKLGLIQGDSFRLTRIAPFQGPLAVQCRGTQIALRREDAKKIEVRLEEEYLENE